MPYITVLNLNTRNLGRIYSMYVSTFQVWMQAQFDHPHSGVAYYGGGGGLGIKDHILKYSEKINFGNGKYMQRLEILQLVHCLRYDLQYTYCEVT